MPESRPGLQVGLGDTGVLHAVSEKNRLQREVHYSGRVQGVGFRYTVRSLAERFAVGGFVRNLPDGRVHLLAEGEEGEIARFFNAIETELGRYITDTKETKRPDTGQFDGFEVRF